MLERQGLLQGREIGPLPPQVLNLPRCEREVAMIVYLEGGMTAKLLEARLPRRLSNSALRAMLQRLCAKGILRRQKVNGSHMESDRRIPYLYTPAITPEIVRARALQQIARDYFDGSLQRLAEEAVRALQADGPGMAIGVTAGRSAGGGLNFAA